MAYREVTMVEIREVLRLWAYGAPKKRIAATLRMDPKTIRSYIATAERLGLRGGAGDGALTDEFMVKLIAELRPVSGRPKGDAWAACDGQRDFVAGLLRQRVRLSK